MLRLVFFCILLSVSFSSNASTVVFDPASTSVLRVVNRIEAMDINITGFSGTFDVIFTSASFDDVQAAGGHPLYDLYSSDPTTGLNVANAVVDQIITVLNTTDANKVGPSTTVNSGFLYLPYTDGTVADTVLAARGRYLSTSELWEALTSPAGLTSYVTDGYIYASLVSSVPVPAAIWLFGSGIIGLIGIARRKSA